MKLYLAKSGREYRNELIDNIMPFWIKNGMDKINGGVYTCLNRDGSLMDTMKSVWFQGRFGYIAARAYNQIEKNPEWLEASKSCIDFILNHCIDTDGHMFFTVTEDGKPVQKRRYVFSETFAVIAMAEYALASGDMSYAQKALDLFKNIKKMLTTPGFLPAKTHKKGMSHSITMILINTASVLQQVCDDPILQAQIDESIDAIEKYFMHPEFSALLESVGPDGEFVDSMDGRLINPGHCIETAWFILARAKKANWDPRLTKIGVTIFDWAFEWGWDEQYGGIINFRDCKNLPVQDYSQDMKFWWPQCETLIASLYCYQATNDPKYLEIYQKMNEWTREHLVDKDYPEWYGYLHRDGSVAQPAKGNIFKGPFHIPRMMMEVHNLAKEICKA